MYLAFYILQHKTKKSFTNKTKKNLSLWPKSFFFLNKYVTQSIKLVKSSFKSETKNCSNISSQLYCIATLYRIKKILFYLWLCFSAHVIMYD